jgi:hypothetical protein
MPFQVSDMVKIFRLAEQAQAFLRTSQNTHNAVKLLEEIKQLANKNSSIA